MRLFRFLSNITAILLLFGFSTALLAQGGGLPGVSYKESGKQYRCFQQIGYAVSSDKDWITGNYCLPSPNGKNCKKDWEWSLDGKDDKVIENKCPLSCRTGSDYLGTGSSNPFSTYSYCVITDDWYKVAKCVDKTTGKDSPNALCESDASGARYYFKPKCSDKDTKENCFKNLAALTTTLSSTGWRFCYNYTAPSPPSGMFRNGNGQSVVFKEYTDFWGSASFPCEVSNTHMSGGNPLPIEPEKPETLGNLIIIDWDDSNQTKSKIHTKISGNKYDFKIYEEGGKMDSGIQSLQCEISDKDGKIVHQGDAGSKFSINSLFAFKFSAPNTTFEKSGVYNIKCVGTSKSGDSVSDTVEFFVAPHSYNFGIVTASFNNSTSNYAKGGVVTESLLDKPVKVKYNETEPSTHDNIKWTKKPVIKIGESLEININEIQALNEKGALDSGVSKDNDMGIIGINKNNNATKFTTLAITNADAQPPTTSTASGDCTPTITQNFGSSAEMINGISSTPAKILTIQADNAMVGKAELAIHDTALYEKIRKQEGDGFCGDKQSFPCPYPASLKVVFEYQVVPANFQAELLDSSNKPLKVLYFGMGQTPQVEATTKLRITALKNDDIKNPQIATTFSKNCAAQNMSLNMEMQGYGFSIKILDKDGKDFIAKADKFDKGVIDADVIVKVNKDKDIDFTPNMKSEPVFTGDKYPNGFPGQMEFVNFPPKNTYYPNYEAKVNSNEPMLILRARINPIDTDNGSGNALGGVANPTKVYYEFQCEYCDLDKVSKITGVNKYDRSPTQQGWWIDRTFSDFNQNKIDKNKLEIENKGNGAINSVSEVTNGLQQIHYGSLSSGTYKLNIRHGNLLDGTTPTAMPNFLLYNAYWSNNIIWNTSSFIYIKSTAKDDNRNYGVDTGGAKNTRSGGRTGKF